MEMAVAIFSDISISWRIYEKFLNGSYRLDEIKLQGKDFIKIMSIFSEAIESADDSY